VAPNAVLSGAVRIGPDMRILDGAVLTAEGNTQIEIGAGCVIMEYAILRAAGRFPLALAEQVLVGPDAHVSGCTVGPRCFIATGAMVFNGATLGEACVVALGGKVHVATELPAGT
jgi:carbonic anhydrase/acetyltransferase-like protein (isoleucine patch superfamily)